MNQSSAIQPLSGSRLDAFLDEVEACFTDAEDSSGESQAAAVGLLHAHTCRTDELAQVRRLFDLWWRAGEHDLALRLLDDQAAVILPALPESERASAELRLLFWRLNALRSQGGNEQFPLVLHQTIDTLARRPVTEQPLEAWQHLSDLTEACGDHARNRQCLRARHACLAGQAERLPYRAWDEAVLAAQLGISHAAAGEAEAARSSAETAVRTLATAPADQDVDRDDWLNLGDVVIPYAPELFESIAAQVRSAMPANLAQPLRRAAEVRLARLESLALHAQGLTAAALEKSRQGRFILSDDSDDAFSARVLDWLLAAGRDAEAAALAFESVFNERSVSGAHACQTAVCQLAAGATDAHWSLALAFAATKGNFAWGAEDEDSETLFNRHLSQVQAWAPGHPALELLLAMRLIDTQSAYAKALPMLERAAHHAELSNPDTVHGIWLCRFHVHGVEKALSLPLVECAAAAWCYNIGVALDHQLAGELPNGTAWPEDAVADMAARYYELGRKKFESFFASGQGMVRDADVHAYSMLCNNLAIHCRDAKNDYDIALALHLRGIAASPFAEHYSGVMECHKRAGRQEDFIASADRLWHFAMEHGYSRHNPTEYVQGIAGALNDLGRGAEIAIWLQRLEDWWAGQDEDEREESYENYLGAVASGLCNLAQSQPADALARLDPILPEIRANGRPGHIRVAALGLIYIGQKERGLALLREASTAGNPNDNWDRTQRQYAVENLAKHAGSRPWWKLW